MRRIPCWDAAVLLIRYDIFARMQMCTNPFPKIEY
jgi:hypothetical protein